MQNSAKNIILLCESESAAQMDRRMLRDAGFPPSRIITSGIEAARLLAGLEIPDPPFAADLVVCDQKLADMDGDQFCAIIRQHPRLLALPVLLVLPNESEAEQLRTLGCGASSLLGRPYSVEKLKNRLENLLRGAESRAKLATGAHQTDTSAFDAALATYGILLRPSRQPEDYFNVGMRCLQEKRWNQAIGAFQLALGGAALKAEAELGMAVAFKGKGDMQKCRGWLSRGAETLVRAKRWHLARSAYARLLKHDPEAKNPFLVRARQLIRLKNYEEAASVLAESVSTISSAKPGDSIARLCSVADDPDAMLKALENSLASGGDIQADALGAEIRQSLESITKERQERQRQLAVERKWQLAKQIAERERQNKNAQASPQHGKSFSDSMAISGSPGNHEDVAPLLSDGGESDDDTFFDEDPLEESDQPNMDLAPLSHSDATNDMFKEKSKFNDLLSVVKLTWKLARTNKKN